MIAQFSIEDTQPDWALAYRFDIVLRGREASVPESEGH
jgi:protocatechuate 3,4-dioxygenase beta subunit